MISPLPYSQDGPGQLQGALADIARDLEQVLARADRLYDKAGRALAAGQLGQPPFSYDDRQLAWIRRILDDLHGLAQVAYGRDVPDGPYNYMAALGQEAGFR